MASYNALRKQVPVWPVGRYRLTERSEMPKHPGAMRELLEADAEVLWDGMPGPHMEPLDAQAQANVNHVIQHLGGFKPLDPTQNLSMIVGEYDDAAAKVAELQAQIDTINASARGNILSGMPTSIAPPKPLAAAGGEPAVAPVPVTVAEGVPGQGGVRPPEVPSYIPPAPPLPPR